MNLVTLAHCPACGGIKFVQRICTDTCIRAGVDGILDASTLNAEPVMHLHTRCVTCQFVWFAPVYDAQLLKEAW